MLGESLAESREELGLVSCWKETPQLDAVGPRCSREVPIETSIRI
jgi:hypothetical protein